MDHRLAIAYGAFFWVGWPTALLAQVNEVAPLKPQSWHNRSALPSWLKLGAELRGRAESSNEMDSASNDGLYLNRLRLDIAVQAAPGVRLFFQGQDARVMGSNTGNDRENLRNTFDVRQAYVDFGTSEEGWLLRVGRQELVLGDERLVGTDNYWDSFGQAFDAVRLGYAKTTFRVDAFTGLRVQPARRRLDPFDTASRISGISVQFKTPRKGVVEPFFLWKRGGDTLDLLLRPGHRDVLTPGIRAQGDLPRSLVYNVEMALQRGHVVGDGISAWAGHWELGWKVPGGELGPRLGLEYNFASGDDNPANGRHGTFDDLYSANFNKYGMAEPTLWRNIRYPAIGVDIPITKRWTTQAGYRLYRLANVHDGLYRGGDQYMLRNAQATSAEVGSHALVSGAYIHSDQWRLHAGYGYIFPGAYLRQSGYLTPLRTAYVQSSFTY